MHVRAAVFGQKPDQLCGLGPVDRVVDKAAGALRRQQPRTLQRVEVVRERRARHFHAPLDLIDALAFRPRAHQEAEDFQPVLLPQGAELFNVTYHRYISSIIEVSMSIQISL